MGIVKDFYSTTVGKKIVMALTGMVLVGFVLGHMLGNLKMFAGIDPVTGRYKLDLYAEFLRAIGAEFMGHGTFLWIFRAVLLVCVALHVNAAISLSALNSRAKPVRAKRKWYGSSNPASRSMLFGGIFIFCFIIYHILHFTTGTAYGPTFVHGMVYLNVYRGFQNPIVSGVYVTAMLFLSMHLYHGTWSLFQTLGIDTPAWNKWIRCASKAVAIVIFIGFSVVPVLVYAGKLPPPPGQFAAVEVNAVQEKVGQEK